MSGTRPPYSPEFRRPMVDLVQAGRDPADLAREFEPSAESIRAWVALAAHKEGGREEKGEGLSAAERDELSRLRRENKQLLEMASGQRRPGDVIHHSDQGSQYTSLAFGNRCREAGVRPCMGSVGDAYDNAMCGSFFATLECELLERRRFASQAEAKMACFSVMEGWYNPVWLHSALGYQSPMAYEAAKEAATAEPT